MLLHAAVPTKYNKIIIDYYCTRSLNESLLDEGTDAFFSSRIHWRSLEIFSIFPLNANRFFAPLNANNSHGEVALYAHK